MLGLALSNVFESVNVAASTDFLFHLNSLFYYFIGYYIMGLTIIRKDIISWFQYKSHYHLYFFGKQMDNHFATPSKHVLLHLIYGIYHYILVY